MLKTIRRIFNRKSNNALKNESETEYVLVDKSVWITVKGFSVYLTKTEEGMIVDVYAKNKENDECIASTYALDWELG
jgi:hypothetical protein